MIVWKDFATAPKDGTNIFAWAPGYDWPETIRYEKYDTEYAEEIGEDGYWRYSEEIIADIAEIEDGELTHWARIEIPNDKNTELK